MGFLNFFNKAEEKKTETRDIDLNVFEERA